MSQELHELVESQKLQEELECRGWQFFRGSHCAMFGPIDWALPEEADWRAVCLQCLDAGGGGPKIEALQWASMHHTCNKPKLNRSLNIHAFIQFWFQ